MIEKKFKTLDEQIDILRNKGLTMVTENHVSFETVKRLKECRDCWHNYHCSMPQEGYDFNPDTCPYNPDNKRENYDSGK